MDCRWHRWFAENAENESFIISQDWKMLAAPVHSIYCPKSPATVTEVPFLLKIHGIVTFGWNWTNCCRFSCFHKSFPKRRVTLPKQMIFWKSSKRPWPPPLLLPNERKQKDGRHVCLSPDSWDEKKSRAPALTPQVIFDKYITSYFLSIVLSIL